MTLVEPFSVFLFSSDNIATVFDARMDPWPLLFFSFASLFFLLAAFFYPWFSKIKIKGNLWQHFFSPAALSSAFFMLIWGYFLSHHGYAQKEVLLTKMLLAWFFSFFVNWVTWYLTLRGNRGKTNIFFAALGFTLALNGQILLTLAAFNGLMLAGIVLTNFALSMLVCTGMFILALWLQSLNKTHAFWQGDAIIATGSAGLALCGVLSQILFLQNKVELVWQNVQVHAVALPIEKLIYPILFGFTLILILYLLLQKLLKVSQHLAYVKQTNQHLLNINNAIVDAIIAIDSKAKVIFYNQAAEQLFGWQAFEIQGRDVLALICDKHKEFFNLNLKRLQQQKMSSVIGMHQEFIVKRKDGSQFPARMSMGIYQQQNLACFALTFANMQDLREQIRYQKEQTREYQALISNLPCTTFRECHEAPSHWVFISENVKVLTGLSANELLSEMGALAFKQNIHQEDEKHYQQVRKKAAMQQGRYEVKFRYQADKKIRWFCEIGYCYQSKDTTVWADGILFDITESYTQSLTKTHDQAFILPATKKYQFETHLESIAKLSHTLLQLKQNPVTTHYLKLIASLCYGLKSGILTKRQDDGQITSAQVQGFSLAQLSKKLFEAISDSRNEVNFHYHYSEALAESYLQNEVIVAQILHNMFDLSLTIIQKGELALSFYPQDEIVRIVIETYTADTIAKNVEQRLFDPAENQLIMGLNGHFWFDLYAKGALLYVDLPLQPLSQHKQQAYQDNQVNIEQKHFSTLSSSMINALVLDDVRLNLQELHNYCWTKGVQLSAISTLDMLKDQLSAQIDMVFIDAYLERNMSIEQIRAWVDKKIIIIALVFSLDKTQEQAWIKQGFDAVLSKPFKADDISQFLIAMQMQINKNCQIKKLSSQVSS